MSSRRRSASRSLRSALPSGSLTRPPVPKIDPAAISVPGVVVTKANQAFNFLWDKDCPFGSLYIWFIVVLALYYLFWIPELTLNVDVGNNKIVPRKIDKKLRGFLFLGTVVSGIIGYLIIRQGCQSAGPAWAFLWFLVALGLTGIVITLAMMGTNNYSLPQAAEMLNQINKLNN